MCLDDANLIRLLSGDATQSQRQAWQEHIDHCATCSARLAAMRATWEELGIWQLSAPETDLTSAILAAAARQSRSSAWAANARMAAAIAIVGTGAWFAGRFTPRPAPPPTQLSSLTVQSLSDQLGLDQLGGNIDLLAPAFASGDMDDDTNMENPS